MTNNTPTRIAGHGARFAFLTAAILAGSMLLFPTPALADHDRGLHRGHGHSKYWKKYDKKRRGVYRHGFHAVPRHLYPGHHDLFRPYYRGRAYYRPHRHHHARYHFPVYFRGRVIHRSYDYCGDDLYVQGVVAMPRLAIDFAFDSLGGLFVEGSFYR